MYTKILATASYVPETRRTNADLEKMVDTTDEWIMDRVGIKERRISKPHESHAFMATQSVMKVVEKAGIHPRQASIILTGNTHVQGLIPPKSPQWALGPNMAAYDVVADNTSGIVESARNLFRTLSIRGDTSYTGEVSGQLGQGVIYHHQQTGLSQVIAKELGMNSKFSFDVITGCASFNYGLALADTLVKKTYPEYVVVAAVDKLLGITNPKDRSTIILFGELAGAALIGPSKQEGFISHHLETEGKLKDTIAIKQEPGWDKPYFWQDGKAVYKWAVPKIVELTRKAVEETRDIGGNRLFIVPHQANPRMVETAKKNTVFKNVYATIVTGDMFGNSSTASIAHALDVLLTEGVQVNGHKAKPEKGDYIGILGFGAGLSSAVNVYRCA